MKYIVRVGCMEFCFKLGAEALHFADRAKVSVVGEEGHEKDVVIELVDEDEE